MFLPLTLPGPCLPGWGGGNETQRGAALKVPAVQAHEGTSQGGKAVQPACGGPGVPSGPGGSGQGEMLFELKPELGEALGK